MQSGSNVCQRAGSRAGSGNCFSMAQSGAEQDVVWAVIGLQELAEAEYAPALDRIRELAKEGHVFAQMTLAHMFESDAGVFHDEDKAAEWFFRAAEQGDRRALAWLSSLARQGNAKARERLRLLAEQGDAGAQRKFADLFPAAEDGAEEWMRRAAEQGDLVAQVNLSFSYEYGIRGFRKDMAEAARWWRKAAEQGEPFAQFRIGWMYATGRGVRKDLVQAYAWLRAPGPQQIIFPWLSGCAWMQQPEAIRIRQSGRRDAGSRKVRRSENACRGIWRAVRVPLPMRPD